jgi:glutamate-5-semialdehyde dehydrogenase
MSDSRSEITGLSQADSQHPEAALALEKAAKAKLAAPLMAQSPIESRNQAIYHFYENVLDNKAKILAANERDMAAASAADPQTKRLKLDDKKLASVVDGLKALIKMPDPLGKVDLARELDKGLELYRVTCPIGVVCVIFEARPDALPQIAALCIKSGDVVILKGGKEAEQTNKELFACLEQALKKANLPSDAAHLLNSREAVQALLGADKHIDLVIPRGGNSLVTYVQNNTRIPVLGHAEGICHIFVDKSADLDMAKQICVDAKINYPSACNAVETLLFHKDLAAQTVVDVIAALRAKGVEVKADATIEHLCASKHISVQPANEADWRTEYGDNIIAVRQVDTVDAAIEHINTYGSAHTDTIICKDDKAWQKFFAGVGSAGVFRNASTRFADGFRYGFGAEVGISTNKMHPRGPVGIEGLVTYKYKLEGSGQIVADYIDGARRFTHQDIKND